MWKLVVTSSNNNLLLKICCKNIVKILWQYFSIRIFYFLYYFSFFHFIFIHTRFISFFLFLVFLLHTSVQCPLLSLSPLLLFSFSPQEHSSNHVYFTSERERERESAACPSPHCQWRSRSPKGQSWWRSAFTIQRYHERRPTTTHPPPHHQARSNRLVLFFFFFHICLF